MYITLVLSAHMYFFLICILPEVTAAVSEIAFFFNSASRSAVYSPVRDVYAGVTM